MPNLPTGTVTFVFSDIEGSTALLKRLGNEGYAAALATHRRLIRKTFDAHGGQEIDTQGDAFFYSFARAREAVAAAVEVQRAHAEHDWPDGGSVRLRLGLHTGEPAVGDEGYTGLDVVRASRIAATGRGGQVLLSDTTRAIVADDLPPGVTMVSLGERQLRDIDRPEPLSELRIPGVQVAEAPMQEAPLASDAPPPTPGMPPGMPNWVLDAASGFGLGERTQDLIEGRVLGVLTDAFEKREARKRERARPARGSVPSSSVADEVERLQALRDSGALTAEQYARAIDRAVSGEG